MRIFSAYIVRSVLKPALIVLFLLLAMIALFDFLDEIDEVGEHDYTAFKAVLYVALSLPSRIVELLPMATLIGTVIGLGVLSSSSELTVMRAAGVSPLRIGMATLRAALVLIFAGAALSEFVAPAAMEMAETMRTNALAPNKLWTSGGHGTWLRSGNDFVNMARVYDDLHAEDIQIFRLNAAQELEQVTQAKRAQHVAKGHWRLEDGSVTQYQPAQVQTVAFMEQEWQSDIVPENLASLQIEPKDMTGRSLFFYVDYLARNGLEWRRYDLEFWRKVVQPLNLFAMVLAGIASVFGPLRSVSVSARILSGVAIGLGFHFLTQLFGPVSLVTNMPPVLAAILPPTLLLMAALWLLKRAR